MTDYHGNLAYGTSGDYVLRSWELATEAGKSIESASVLGGNHIAQGAVLFNGSGTITAEITVQGSSVATLTALKRAVRAEAGQPSNTWVHAPGTSGSAVIFRVLECARPEIIEEHTYGVAPYWSHQKLVLTVAPYADGALQTLHSAVAVATPASLSLAALLGDLPTPLRLYCDDASTYDIHSFVAALAPAALTDDMWLLDSASSRIAWSGGDHNASPAGYYSTGCRRNSSTTPMTGTVDVSGYPAGLYRPVARVAVAAGYGYVRSNVYPANEDIAITRTTLHYAYLPDIWLPPSAVKSGTASNLIVYVTGDGTNYAYLDYLLLVPLWLGCFQIHPTSPVQEFDEVDLGPEGLYIDGATDWTPEEIKGDVLRPRATAMLCPELVTTHSPDGSTWAADWTRSDVTDVTATGSKFQIVSNAVVRSAYAGPFVVVEDAWYEILLDKQVTARTAGSASFYARWYDIAGTLLVEDLLATYAAADGAPVTGLAFYAQTPLGAAHLRIYGETAGAAGCTVQFWNVYAHRCPLRLILASEDAGGTAGTQSLAVTVQAFPRYEGAR